MAIQAYSEGRARALPVRLLSLGAVGDCYSNSRTQRGTCLGRGGGDRGNMVQEPLLLPPELGGREASLCGRSAI